MAKGDIISRLKLESGEFDAKIKRAGQELLNYAEHCRKMSQSMGYANKDAKEFAKALGSMETVSNTARGKINELSEAFVNAKVMFKNMTDEEKKSEFGRNLSTSIDQLKTRLNAAKKDLSDVQSELNGSKFGQFGSVIDTIGHKLGLTTNATELLTSKTALMYSGIGAGIAIIGKATQAWASYNAELAKQDQITVVTTGLKDDDAKRMTDTMRALSDTYKVDFRDAINAANTLMSQFGVSGDEAIRLIKDGMKGMIYGDGGKLLSMIQQYAPAFQSAGVSASQLVAVIHNSEGGIFTDQNMNAIVMGIKNIRLMTNATSEALAKLGLDGQDMAKKMNNGSMTVFDALKLVAGQLKNVDSNSQAAGEVMQQVFGRQGAMAGTNLAKAIEGLNTDLEQTKKQLGDVGDAYDKLQEANERLNTAIRDAFGYDGWEQMATGIKTSLIGALSDVIEHLAIIEEGFGKIKNFFGGGGSKATGIGYEDVKKTQQWINNGKDDDERRRRYDKAIADLQKKLNNVGKEYRVKNSDGSISFKIDDVETQARKRAALEKRMRMLYATSFTPEPDVIKPLPTKPTNNTKTSTVDKEAEQTARMLAELRKAEAKATKEIADARAREHQTETKGLSGFNEQNIANWTSIMKKDLESADFGSVVYNQIVENMKDMSVITDLTKEALKRGLDPQQLGLTELFEAAFDNIDVPDQAIQSIIDKINAMFKDNPIKIDVKTGKVETKNISKDGKEVAKDWNNAASAISSVGSAMSQIEDPAAKVMGTIAQAIATIALTYAKSLEGTFTPWDWIAGAAAGLAQMTAVISAIHSSTGYAEGGVVKGNSYSGDNLMAQGPNGQLIGLNAGEVVLNRAQSANLASQLQGSGGQTVRVVGKLSGESLFLCAENWAKRTGRGEFVTWR